MMHAHCARVRHGDGGGRTSLQAHSSMSQKAILAHTSKHTDVNKWVTWTVAPTLGILGLIPATVCVLALKENGNVVSKKRADASSKSVSDLRIYDAHAEELAEAAQENLHLVYLQSAFELILESMPQAVLQTYIGVAYGQFEQNATTGRTSSWLLVASILCSFLASGVVMFDLEAEERNQDLPSSHHLRTLSLYGFVTIVGRAGQVGSLVFINGLFACAFKGMALITIIFAVALLYGLTMYSKIQSKGSRSVSPNTVEAIQYAGHTTYVMTLLVLFYFIPHQTNDYDRSTAGSNSLISPDFNCKQRDSSINMLLLFWGVSVFGMIASLLLDPQWGWRADGSTRRGMTLARAEEDARAELRAARGWITAAMAELEQTEWELSDMDKSAEEVDLQDDRWVVREYRRKMLEAIGKQVFRACQLHCRQTGQPCSQEAQWKYRQHRKLRWEAPTYFLLAEYAAWEYREVGAEANLHDQHRIHKERTQHIIDVDEVHEVVDEYQGLLESFLEQTYAHPRCYKWEEQALWEASEKVAELEEELVFTTMYKFKPSRHRFGRGTWTKEIVRIGTHSDENASISADVAEAAEVDTVEPSDGCSVVKLECFDIEAFNLANHHDRDSLQPTAVLLLSDVTHCRKPHINNLKQSKHAQHAMELVTSEQSWILAAQTVKDKRRWLRKLSTLFPSHTAVDDALADLHSEAARRKRSRGFKRLTRREHGEWQPDGEAVVLETQNPTFEASPRARGQGVVDVADSDTQGRELDLG